LVALQMFALMAPHLQAVNAYAAALPGFLANLRERFYQARPASDGIEHLVGREVVNKRIAEEQRGAREEITAAQPGARTAEDLAYSFDRDRAALERGLTMRTLYHSGVRRVARVGAWAHDMAAAGGEVRTVNGRFPRTIIFDRRVAFVPVHTRQGEPPADEAVLITDPLVAARLAADFDLYWDRADPWYGGTSRRDEGLTTSRTQRAILRELCLGRNQKQAAKNLGISSAWVNDQMRDLRVKLGVETLNEVIYWWRGSADHDVHD
jgi:DNA-binding CsgD family transcriptional regulator